MVVNKFEALTAVGVTPMATINQSGAALTVQFNLTGDPLSGVIDIEGSLDGVNFVAIDSHTVSAPELAAFSGLYFIADKPVKYIRANVSTLTFTTAGSVIISIHASK